MGPGKGKGVGGKTLWMLILGGGGNLFMPTLLFLPLRFQNSKFEIGKKLEKT